MRPERSLVLLLALALAGCQGPRLVRVDGEGGVVAIPSNTNYWPTYYRDKAELLIQSKCPDGYEIIREEEKVTGQVVHTDTQTTTEEAPTMMLGGSSGKSNHDHDHGESFSESFGGFAVPLGETQQNTEQRTSYHDVTEWRIHFRKK